MNDENTQPTPDPRLVAALRKLGLVKEDPRLVAALERALATQAVVTLVDAPPGFGGAGKVTALHPTAVEVHVYLETGSPTIRVPLAELAWVGEGPGWLVVSLGEPAGEQPAPSQPERPELPPGYSVIEGSNAFWADPPGDRTLRSGGTREQACAAAWADFRREHPEWTAYLDAVAQPAEDEVLQPALYSVRAAMRAAGVPGWESGSGVSSADAIRHLARERDEARSAAAEPPPIPEGCTWDGAELTGHGYTVSADKDGDLRVLWQDGPTASVPADMVEFALYQYDRAQAGGGQ
jgi:hypothetical protein